jgi:uncharacterized protein
MADFHAFKIAGRMLLYFSRSARLYELDQGAEQLLGTLSGLVSTATGLAEFLSVQEDSAAPDPAAAEFQSLLRDELKLPPPSGTLWEKLHQGNDYRNFSLYISQTCNMSCSYCWNKGGSFGKTGQLMDLQTAQSATRLIARLAAASSAGDIHIHFYGGEPLLNYRVLRYITLELEAQGRLLGKRFLFNLDTNGYFLEGDEALFLAQHFSEIGISLDGRQETHDRQRPLKNGEGSWEKVVANAKAFPRPELLGVRGTLTATSESYQEMFRQLTSLGIRRIQLEYCHEPGYQRFPEYRGLVVDEDRQHEELRQFLEVYLHEIKQYGATGEIPYLSNLLDNVARVRRGERHTRPCGAGVTMLAIDSRGAVFPCIAFADYPAFAMGCNPGGDLSLPEALQSYEVDVHQLCGSCWARYDCAGGCYASHYEMSGSVRQPHPHYCHNTRQKTELYLYAIARMREECPWHLEP